MDIVTHPGEEVHQKSKMTDDEIDDFMISFDLSALEASIGDVSIGKAARSSASGRHDSMARAAADPVIPFRIAALLDVYRVTSNSERSDLWVNFPKVKSSIVDLEHRIASKSTSAPLHLAASFLGNRSYMWYADVYFSSTDPMSLEYEVRHRGPSLINATCALSRLVGMDRLMQVSVHGIAFEGSQYSNEHWAQRRFLETGIVLGGRTFRFFCAKEAPKKSSRTVTSSQQPVDSPPVSSNSSTSSNHSFSSSGFSAERNVRTKFICYFIAVDDDQRRVTEAEAEGVTGCRSDSGRWQSSSACFVPSLSISSLRLWFGDFSGMTDLKRNSRLALSLSPSSESHFTLTNRQVIVVEDIVSEKTGKVMTDGCGFISADLARQLPEGIARGRVSVCSVGADSGSTSSRRVLPSIIQVRYIGDQGVFKGCLLVTADPTVCPPLSVVFRMSMRKVPPLLYSRYITCPHTGSLDVVHTFEKHRRGRPDGRPLFGDGKEKELSTYTTTASTNSLGSSVKPILRANLNRQACLLLQHLGVPLETFDWLMIQDVERVLAVGLDKRAAWNLLLRHLKGMGSSGPHSSGLGGDEDDVLVDELDADRLVDTPMPSLNHTRSASASAAHADVPILPFPRRDLATTHHALNMILAGHSLDEPFLRQTVNKLQLEALRKLQKCQMGCDNSVYLVGAPDPYCVLQPGEVYIQTVGDGDGEGVEVSSPYVSDMIVEPESAWMPKHRGDGSVITGDVLVMRSPMHHPGDLRKLRAVSNARLEEFFSGTCGGVIVFSVLGERAAADEMSGGDYDGDKFLVIFESPYLVDVVTAVEPAPPAEEILCISEDTVSGQALSPMSPSSPSRKDVEEAEMGWAVFKEFILRSQAQNLGRLSMSWLAYADDQSFGVSHPLAIRLQAAVNIEMDSHKSGKRINTKDFLRHGWDLAALPPYLSTSSFVSKKPDAFKLASGARHQSKLLQRLYNIATGAMESVTSSWRDDQGHGFKASSSRSSLGSSMASGQRAISAVGFELDIHLRLQASSTQEQRQFDELFSRWCVYYKQFNKDLAMILRCIGFDEGGNSLSANSTQALKQKYRNLFDLEAESLFNLYCRPFTVQQLLTQSSSATGFSLGVMNYRSILHNCRRFVALAVYAAVYRSAVREQAFGFAPLSFCWDICADELHDLKAGQVKRSTGRSELSQLDEETENIILSLK